MTPTPGAPEDLSERPLCKADIEGILVMDELVDRAGKVRLIRERQTLDQVHQNEITVTDSVF